MDQPFLNCNWMKKARAEDRGNLVGDEPTPIYMVPTMAANLHSDRSNFLYRQPIQIPSLTNSSCANEEGRL
jgi:hypothetical protein